jgi:AcrR family transcriptional regulator
MAAGTRDRLLDAASAVLLREGAHALTLEAVAAEAGVSKGGLLYHFKSKSQLLDALVERWDVTVEQEIEARSDGRPGAWLRAYLETSAHLTEEERRVEIGLLAALAAEPERLGPVRERYARWQERAVADGVDPVDATLVRLAADGLWIADLLGFAPPAPALRARLVERLRELTEQRDAG